jgi:hypothetical protein
LEETVAGKVDVVVAVEVGWGADRPDAAARAVAPTFNTKVQLLGNSVYNTEDWDVNADEAGSIATDGPGIVYAPDKTTSGNSVRHQFKPAFVVQGGVAWATFRLAVTDDTEDDTDSIGFFFGLYDTATDPFTTAPCLQFC